MHWLRPRMRMRYFVLVLAACGASTGAVDGSAISPGDPIGHWTSLSSAGRAPDPRSDASGVWTGSRVIVWGGIGCTVAAVCGDGFVIDPIAARATNVIASSNAPVGRAFHSAVWTGSRMIVWGGSGCGSITGDCVDGGSYDPAGDAWAPITAINAPAGRGLHTALWTGTEMLVWGGQSFDRRVSLNDGSRYDASQDTWRAVATINAPSPRRYHSAVWTGSEMIVWGGDDRAGARSLADGARYDPASDVWTPMAAAPLAARYTHGAVWTGTEMIVWGGLCGTSADLHECFDGAAYDPTTDHWRMITANGGAHRPDSVVWTGSGMLDWGSCGSQGCNAPGAGALYDPVAATWSPLLTTDAPGARGNAVVIWAGDRLVVYGGALASEPQPITGDGAVWRPQ